MFSFNLHSSHIIVSMILLGFLQSCTISYSLSGADPQGAQTASVQYFPNRAPMINDALSETFTESLRDMLLRQTSLSLVSSSGDINYEGEITDYRIEPLAVQGDDLAAENRLTITIKVKFTNAMNDQFDFDTNFTRFADYPSDQDFLDVEATLVEDILTQIIEDVFNRSLVNW